MVARQLRPSLSFEDEWQELVEGASPCEPFVVCALTDVIVDIDASLSEVVGERASAEVLFAATAEEKRMHTSVE